MGLLYCLLVSNEVGGYCFNVWHYRYYYFCSWFGYCDVVSHKEDAKMIRGKYFVWMMPIGFIAILTACACLFQSCSGNIPSATVNRTQSLKEVMEMVLESYYYIGIYMFVSSLILGLMLWKINKMSKSLANKGYDV